MFVVLTGSSMPGSPSSSVADLLADQLVELGRQVHVIDLSQLPGEIFSPAAWVRRPDSFGEHERALLDARGLVVVVEERGGAVAGELKLFLDLVRYPGAFAHLPCAFVGVSDGPWGAVRAVEQVELALHHLGAHLFGSRIFMRHISDVLDVAGRMPDPGRRARMQQLMSAFVGFSLAIRPADESDPATEEIDAIGLELVSAGEQTKAMVTQGVVAVS
jgi:NAD(P)H-dependent FMN reductase